MIKRFIRRVLGLPSDRMVRVARSKHGLAPDALSASAGRVCAVLREAGFSAYVVGGAVRDLLLGQSPKDWDIATDAPLPDLLPSVAGLTHGQLTLEGQGASVADVMHRNEVA